MDDKMISQAAQAGGGSQLNPDQCLVHDQGSSKTMVAGQKIRIDPQASSPFPKVTSRMCSFWELLFLFSVILIIAGAQGDHQTGPCELLDPAISLDVAATPETIGLSPRPSTEPVPAERTNGCIPHVVLHAENPGSPDHSGPPSPVGEKLKVGIVLAILVTMGITVWMLWRRRPTFTEADINRGLMREPAVARRSDRTFDIPERLPVCITPSNA